MGVLHKKVPIKGTFTVLQTNSRGIYLSREN